MKCKHCDKEILLRSFRLPPNACNHCGQLQDPDLPRSNYGCLVLFPVAVLAVMTFAYFGFHIGRLLGPAVNMPDLGFRLAFIAGADALGIVSLMHVKLFRGGQDQHLVTPVSVFLTFAAVGTRCGHGHGVPWLLICGFSNGILATFAAYAILHAVPSPTPNA